MRRHLTVLLLMIVSAVAGQENPYSVFFESFAKQTATVRWLLEYDMIAWHSSDSVVKHPEERSRLGSEWFCFKDLANTWHAVYGKYANNNFDLVFHYVTDESKTLRRTNAAIDTSLLHSYSRAIQAGLKKIDPIRDSLRVNFNQFIRRESDDTFSVWFFPAVQSNGYAVYGLEYVYQMDSSGRTVLRDDSFSTGRLRGHPIDRKRKLELDYRMVTEPTLGSVFFATYCVNYFTQININTRYGLSYLSRSKNGELVWFHIDSRAKR